MPKFLLEVTYTAEGAKGVAKEGGSSRRKAAEQLIHSVGGKLESLYFAFGKVDVYCIAEFPDHAAAAACSLALAQSGAASGHGVVLMTPEEMDAAAKLHTKYRPPGH